MAEDVECTNGHAARMRYSRFRQHMEGPNVRQRQIEPPESKSRRKAKNQKRRMATTTTTAKGSTHDKSEKTESRGDHGGGDSVVGGKASVVKLESLQDFPTPSSTADTSPEYEGEDEGGNGRVKEEAEIEGKETQEQEPEPEPDVGVRVKDEPVDEEEELGTELSPFQEELSDEDAMPSENYQADGQHPATDEVSAEEQVEDALPVEMDLQQMMQDFQEASNDFDASFLDAFDDLPASELF